MAHNVDTREMERLNREGLALEHKAEHFREAARLLSDEGSIDILRNEAEKLQAEADERMKRSHEMLRVVVASLSGVELPEDL